MTSVTGQTTAPGGQAERPKGSTIFDLAGIDLDARIFDREHIEKYIPHRHAMSLVDHIVWESDDHKRGVGVWEVGDDEFWVDGHFPSKALLPGVLMIEAGAQLACYLYNVRHGEPAVVLFLRIEDAAFRAGVEPGQSLYLLCDEIKAGRRKFSCRMQGLVENKIAFDATITGMRIEDS